MALAGFNMLPDWMKDCVVNCVEGEGISVADNDLQAAYDAATDPQKGKIAICVATDMSSCSAFKSGGAMKDQVYIH